MNDILRERLIRKLDTLPEEKIYQILDYIDFLESKYAPKLSTAPNPLKRFAEGVEDTLRAGKMSAGVIGGTMSVMNKAVGVVTDVANAGKSVATEIAGVVVVGDSSKPPARGGALVLASNAGPSPSATRLRQHRHREISASENSITRVRRSSIAKAADNAAAARPRGASRGSRSRKPRTAPPRSVPRRGAAQSAPSYPHDEGAAEFRAAARRPAD